MSEITIVQRVKVPVSYIYVNLPVRFDDEDMAYDAPMRTGDTWSALIELETGTIVDWPKGKSLNFFMKVYDSGIYVLYDSKHVEVASLTGEYVPHGVIPGEYGDYVHLNINEEGVITNWPKKINLS